MEQAITVSQLNRYIKLKFEHDVRLSSIYVSGEISNFTNHLKSGHFYFSLKDADASIKAVMFRQYAEKVRFTPSDGQKVVVRGQVSAYERDGIYQIYVTELIPDGVGNISLAFEQLKRKLSDEGLFDDKHKKSLPRFPEKIGIVTSPTGAAIQDMLNIFSRRYPVCELVLYPALVQGGDAASDIAGGIKYFNNCADIDIIIVGRGGGSAEDLWCFNDEGLAREIFASKIPVVSCVGHQTDYTISDMVADLRAPTPSAAAELCVPDTESVEYLVSQLASKAESLIKKNIMRFSDRVSLISDRPCLKSTEYYITSRSRRISELAARQCFQNPEAFLENKKSVLAEKERTLANTFEKMLLARKGELSAVSSKLDGISPLKTLARGYCVTCMDGRQITAKDVEKGDEVSIRFFDGTIDAKVVSKKVSEH